MPFYLWARVIAGQKLLELHRRHLGAQRRDVRREVHAPRWGGPEVSSFALSEVLAADGDSPPTAAHRAELRQRVGDALEELDELDREVLALRHFEQLSNAETALALVVSESAASRSFLRATRRMKELLGCLREEPS